MTKLLGGKGSASQADVLRGVLDRKGIRELAALEFPGFGTKNEREPATFRSLSLKTEVEMEKDPG